MKTISKILRYRGLATIVISFSIFFILPQWLHSQEESSKVDTPWQLKIEKEGVQLYSRWMPATPQMKTRQLRGVFFVEASPEEVLQLIQFESSVESWINRSKVAYTFNKNQEGNQWFSYTQFALPWPISDQDLVLENNMQVSIKERLIHIQMYSVEGVMDSQKGVKRIQQFEGSWQLKGLPSGKTQVEYKVQTKNKSSFPTWITDPVVQQNLLHTLSNLRSAAEKFHLTK